MLIQDSPRGVTTWDPSYSFSVEMPHIANIYETLLRIGPNGEIQYVLATSYEVSEDGLTWTFHLRQGVKFHDGTNFNATAVKFSIERHARVYWTTGQGAGYLWWMVADDDNDRTNGLTGIEIVDAYTVKFHLIYPVPLDTIIASIYGAWIISPKIAEIGSDSEIKAWFDQGHDAGTGPYMIEEYEPNDHIILKRFNDYWGGWKEGQFEKIYIKYVPDANTQLTEIKGGSADIAMTVPVESISDLQQNWADKIKVYIHQSVYNYLMFFNTRKYPLNITLVRQALSYAVPYQDIIEAIGGYARQAKGPVPYGLWPHNEELFQYTYNLTKAQELLNQAGIDPTKFSLRLTHAAENPAETAWAPLIEEAFEELGFQVTVDAIPWSQQWTEAMTDPDSYDLFLLLWWPTYPNGYDNMENMFASWVLEWSYHFNFAWYNNSLFDYYLWTAYTTEAINKTKAFELYTTAQEILINDAPAAFLYDAQEIITMNAKIKGFVYNINFPGTVFFYDLTWEESSSNSSQSLSLLPIIANLALIIPIRIKWE